MTAIGPALFAAPVNVNVIARRRCRPPATRRSRTTLIDRFAEPLPDGGLTCSHGWFDAAVHVTVPLPLCVRRTTCAEVCATNAAPVVTAPNVSEVLSSATLGSDVIGNDSGGDVPPPGPGVKTVIEAVPEIETSLARIVACNCVPPIHAVWRAAPFQRTSDPLMKLLPLTVNVNPGPPAPAAFGDTLDSVGTGFERSPGTDI